MSRNYEQHPECFPEHTAMHNPARPEGEQSTERSPDECQFCHVEHKVAVPCIHSNGTAAENLRDDLDLAAVAVQHTINIMTMTAAAPNARDYYVLPGGSTAAMFQHRARMEKLDAVLGELQEMRDHVQAVIDFKEEQRSQRIARRESK